MFTTPAFLENKKGVFTFGSKIRAEVYETLNNTTLAEMYSGFCCSAGSIDFTSTDKMEIVIGKADVPKLDGYSYAINITETGISATAENTEQLTNAFVTILELIKPICLDEGNEKFEIPCALIKDTPASKIRMVHLCIFPETTLLFVRKFIRLASVLRYSHIIIEFWGTYKYKCLKELAWKDKSYTREEIEPIIKEANEAGLEVIPMFNHLGHAAGARSINGKHVVLDQNPRLATLFDEDGWTWDITKSEVRELLREIRQELCDLCGSGEYFLLGCDEAYIYRREERIEMLADYLNELCREVCELGRRPIIWHDMLLDRSAVNGNPKYICNALSREASDMLAEKLDKRLIIADWQYDSPDSPLLSSLYFKERGFDVLCCPFDKLEPIKACAETAKECYGFMMTTWHTLSNCMHMVTYASTVMWQNDTSKLDGFDCIAMTGAFMRKALPLPAPKYEETGWTEYQVGTFY